MASAQPGFSQTVSLHSCENCSVRSCCLAGGLDSKQLEKFESSRGNLRILQSGQHLFRSGEKFNAVYIVRSGMLKTTVTSEDGTEQVTGFYLSGEMLGIDGIENDQYHTSAVALETCSVCVLPFHRLTSLGTTLPAVQQQLWCQISREIVAGQDLLMYLGRKDAEARIAGFLLSMSQRFKRIGYSASSFYLPMGRQDIGNYLGMTLETVSRVLTRFEKSGVISKDRKIINIISFNALSAVSLGKSLSEYSSRQKTHAGKTSVFHPALSSRKPVNGFAVTTAQAAHG